MSSETSSAPGFRFDEPNCKYIWTFAASLESSVSGLQKKTRPPRMCRICRTFRKSYPFGAHAATNRPKSTMKVPAFLDFWLTGYRCSGRFLWMSGHFWSRSGMGFRNFGSRPLKIQSLKYKVGENPWLSAAQNWKSQIIDSGILSSLFLETKIDSMSDSNWFHR